MRTGFNIQCSCCGTMQKLDYTVSSASFAVKNGWNSCGSALYCPVCTKGWTERNSDRPMGGDENTLKIIIEKMFQEKEREEIEIYKLFICRRTNSVEYEVCQENCACRS